MPISTNRLRELAAATLNSIGDAVLSTDVDGRVIYLNLAAEAMTGWPREEAAGRPLDDVFHIIDCETRAVVQNPLSLAVQLNKTVSLATSCLLVTRDGREVEIEDSAAPVRDETGRVTGAVIVFRDVGHALEMSRRMSHLAQHDALTGLPNRWLLTDRLGEAIAQARRRDKPLAVLFLDVDGFKAVNDSLGHLAADEVLRSMATRLRGALRQSDTACRYGGDEFVIVLPEIDGAGDAALVARKLLQVITAPHQVNAHGVTVSAGVGISLYPDHGDDADSLIASADAAMYEAKRAGPGNYRVASARSASPRAAAMLAH